MRDQKGQHVEPAYDGFKCRRCGEDFPFCICAERDKPDFFEDHFGGESGRRKNKQD